MEIVMHSIGVIHSPFTEKIHTPIQSARSPAAGQVHIFPDFLAGLQDLEGFSHIFLLYVFHESRSYELRVLPFLDDQVRGLFSTRHPCRPNPIGLSVVELIGINGDTLEILGVDMLDGTPLLDIKPYVPEFDVRDPVRTGWYERRARL